MYLKTSFDGCEPQPSFQGLDWGAEIIRTKGRSLVLIQGYFDCGAGTTDVNLQKYRQVVELIKILNLPYIWCADWNMTPDEVQDASWPSQAKGQILRS